MDKREKKALRQRARVKRTAAAETDWAEHMVLRPEQLKALLDHLDRELPASGCDHSHRLTLTWAAANGVQSQELIESLERFGGGCDSEVLANVDPETQVDGWPSYVERFRSR